MTSRRRVAPERMDGSGRAGREEGGSCSSAVVAGDVAAGWICNSSLWIVGHLATNNKNVLYDAS